MSPEGENETDCTPEMPASTSRVDKHDPEVMSHVLMVVSSEALTTILGLSGLKATHFTGYLLKHNKLVLTKR